MKILSTINIHTISYYDIVLQIKLEDEYI